MARPEKVRLGEILVQQKRLSEEQLGLALADHGADGAADAFKRARAGAGLSPELYAFVERPQQGLK